MSVATASFTRRVRGILTLDVRAYEEVEADRAALGQALLVVVLGSVSAGMGAAAVAGAVGAIQAAGLALGAWLVWAVLVYVIGVHLLPEPQTRSDVGEIARVIGFAAAPNLFAAFAFLPGIGPLVQIALAVWLMMTMIVGVRQALEYRSTARAVTVVLIGWVAYVTLLLIV